MEYGIRFVQESTAALTLVYIGFGLLVVGTLYALGLAVFRR